MKKRFVVSLVLILVLVAESVFGVSGGFVYTSTGWQAPDKDPGAVLDYTLNWRRWLRDDTIETSTWEISSGLDSEATDFTDTTATIWLSGGTNNVTYTVTNTITTAGGRTAVLSFRIKVRTL